ncbi:TetR/AcrR family transcriptional regulator [Marivita sp. S0852]|uniref:TetR/AcrR family transcriptional regulator n=1 Tax=Marivita sp. S0852 TaxID=3373893 RepID=UPI003981D874
MDNKRAQKKEDLRNRMIDAAEEIISEKGLANLKARDVTAQAGCALGAIYTVVADLDELIMRVNSCTLSRLGVALHDALPKDASPKQTMHALAAAYVGFALENTTTWSAIFSHRLPEGTDVPEWHRAEYPVLIAEIIEPLSQLRPDLLPDQLRLRAQTVFAAVHGVVQLSIHGRFVGVPRDMLAAEVDALVDAMTRGLDTGE